MNVPTDDNSCLNSCAVLLLCAFGFFALCAFCSSSVLEQFINPQTISGKVVDAYIKRVGEADVYFVAILPQGQSEPIVLTNKDAFWRGKTNSSDVQQRMKLAWANNETVTVEVSGWRITLFSWYPNINFASYKPAASQ